MRAKFASGCARSRAAAVGAAVSAIVCLAAARAPGDDAAYQAARKQHDAWAQRPSLYKRTLGREALARTGDPRALRVLAGDYRDAESPRDRVRALLVSLAAAYCDRPEHLPIWAEWRAANPSADDAWLWQRSLRIGVERGELEPVDRAIATAGSIWLKGAAIEALDAGSALARIPALLAAMPAKPLEQGVLVRSVASLLPDLAALRDRDEFAAACEAVIATLDSKTVPTGAKHVAARFLATALEWKGAPWLAADDWRRLLAARAWTQPKRDDDARYAETFSGTFAGLGARGERFCYVIDASDSMLKEVTAKERGPVTGTGTGGPTMRREMPDLPWDRIRTRFDLARALVAASLRQLDERKRFAIVLVGDGATLLHATPALVPATRANVEKATGELDAMRAGPPMEMRPDGTLLGMTNLHGGFDRAFRVTLNGLEPRMDYVDGELLESGADSLFVFSDGVPSWDDFAAIDRRDPEDEVGDPESDAPAPPEKKIQFFGPYVEDWRLLIDDVRRMNLFRNAEIHCVGIGEASMELLRDIAATAGGSTKQIGADRSSN
jgi:hypothetical protein